MTAIVWYRDDLRVSDHLALSAATKSHASIVFIYVLDDRAPGIRPLGGAARWWLAQSLRALQASLRERGASLVLRKGSAPTVIAALAREVGAEAVYWNEIAQAPHRAVEDQVAAALAEIGIVAHRFPGDLLASPSQIRNKENRGLRVFTPFWRRVQALGDPPKPLPAPKTLKGVANLASDRLEDWKLEPTRPDWAGGLRDTWQPGEAAAQAAPQGVPRRRHCRLFRRSRPARPRRHLAALAASSFRRNQSAPDLACRALRRGRAPSPVRRYRKIPQRTRLARVLPSSAVRRPRSRHAQPAAPVRRLSVEARCQGLARVAARPDRLSHRRCRHA